MPAKKETEKSKPKTKQKAAKDNSSTDLSVGEILRRARVSEKLSLDKVEEDIRIRASMLQAIEDMELDRLPGWIYTVGFIRTYSDYLDLDSDKMVALLKSQVGEKKSQKLDFPVTASESAMPDPIVIGMAGLGLIALIVGVFIFQSFMNSPTSSDGDVNAIPPVPIVEKYADSDIPEPPTEAATPANTNTSGNEEETEEIAQRAPRDANGIILPQKKPNPQQATTTLDSNYRIIIDVIDESWVEISDAQGEVLVSRVLKQGDQYYVPQKITGLTMTTGNIAGIQISVDGQKLNVKGAQGEIKRDIPLDPQSLKEIFP